MIVKLLNEHNLEFLSLKGGCTGSSESTLVKMPHCWTSHAMGQFQIRYLHKKGNCNLSQYMRFPTMWFVQSAKPQISLRIRAV